MGADLLRRALDRALRAGQGHRVHEPAAPGPPAAPDPEARPAHAHLDGAGARGGGPGPARGHAPAPALICEAQPKASRAHSNMKSGRSAE